MKKVIQLQAYFFSKLSTILAIILQKHKEVSKTIWIETRFVNLVYIYARFLENSIKSNFQNCPAPNTHS